VIIGGPILVYQLVARGSARHVVAWAIGLILLLATLPVSVADVVKHLLSFAKPKLQKHVVRLLLLPVVFSLSSYLCLVFREVSARQRSARTGFLLGRRAVRRRVRARLAARGPPTPGQPWPLAPPPPPPCPSQASLAIETFRDFYEAFAIYSFTSFMLEAAGGEAALAERLRAKPSAAGAHIPPMGACLRPWPMGAVLLRRCKAGVLQYVVVRLVLTALTLILEQQHVFEEGEFRWDRGYVYVTVVANFSQLVAVYCLLLLLQAAHEELTPVRAWPKLLCVKAVIFFVWWQGVAIAVLVQAGMMPSTLEWTEQEVGKGLQNLAVVVEMLPAALAHRWAFPVADFAPPEREFVAVRTDEDGEDDDGGGGGLGGGQRRAPRRSRRRASTGSGSAGAEQVRRAAGPRRRGEGAPPHDAAAPGGAGPAAAASGGGAPRPGVFAAFLESTLPTDVVRDIRRTVLPTPAKGPRDGVDVDHAARRMHAGHGSARDRSGPRAGRRAGRRRQHAGGGVEASDDAATAAAAASLSTALSVPAQWSPSSGPHPSATAAGASPPQFSSGESRPAANRLPAPVLGDP